MVGLLLLVSTVVLAFLLGQGEPALDDERPVVIRFVFAVDPADPDFAPPALVLGGADADLLGVGPRIEPRLSGSEVVWRIETSLVETEDIPAEYCFRADVVVEESGRVAVGANTCTNPSGEVEVVLT
jgi:hypothetical protein